MTLPVASFVPASEGEALEAIRAYQRDLCATCGRSRPLVVDHDHETGLVRGLLCYTCNAGEGRKSDRRFDAYRRNPPASVLALPVEYGLGLWGGDPDSEEGRERRAFHRRFAATSARSAGPPRRTKRALALAATLHASPEGERLHAYDLRNQSGVRAGSLYDLLNRMVVAGWLTDGWEDPAITRQEKRPPRRYYTVTPAGRAALAELLEAPNA